MPYRDVVHAAASVLGARGPLTEDALVSELQTRGIDLGEYPKTTLQDAFDEELAPAMFLDDGRLTWLPALLDGRMFTHRLTDLEVAHDLLFIVPDLGPAEFLLPDDNPQLADGTPIRSLFLPYDGDILGERGVRVDDITDQAVLLLPEGHADARKLRPNDLIGVRVTGDGLALEVVDVPDGSAPTAELVTALSTVLDSDEPVELDQVIWTLCADQPHLFRRPARPLTEVLAACGLVQDGDWIARDGFDFAAWQTDRRCELLIRRYDLSKDEALAVLAGVALYEQVCELYDTAALAGDDAAAELTALFGELAIGHQPTSETAEAGATLKDALVLLDEPIVAAVLLEETTGYDVDQAAQLGLLAEILEPQMPRTTRPALRWLRAKAYELLGDIETAERTLLAAETLDHDWPPTLVGLARYAFDRGDTTRGLSLLRRAGAPADDPMVEALERYESTPPTGLGRNDPCWCGSGRKYKNCHINTAQLAPEDRALWLYQKACLFLMDEPRHDRFAELGELRAQYADSEDAIWEAMNDPLVADALLFEGGVFEEFLDTRGVLLPDDEQLLAQEWCLGERSVHAVTEIQAGDHLTLRDLRTGDVHEVRERTASTYLTRGQLICARIVQAGDTLQIFGGIEPVALHQRDELIALLDSGPGPEALVELLTRRFAPTVLQNTDGDPLVFCDASLRVSDSAEVSNVLDDAFDRPDPTEPEWVEYVTTDGVRRVGAALRLISDELYVETNSEERHERVLSRLYELVPSIVLVTESRMPARDAREAAELVAASGNRSQLTAGPPDPAVAAALEQYILEYEQGWLDTPIPALTGTTPRQAAADPTRRNDLIRLLDSFPAARTPGAMSPDRLRAALDLPPK